MSDNPQIPWTDEQWSRVNNVIQEEASRARVAASFLPLFGPLSADADFVRADIIGYPAVPAPAGLNYPGLVAPAPLHVAINDRATIQLATLQVKVYVRGAQMADPDLTSVLALFRRAANVLARLEDAVVFHGLTGPAGGPFAPPAGGLAGLLPIWEISGGQAYPGILATPGSAYVPVVGALPAGGTLGGAIVTAVSDAIGQLEDAGHFGPFAVVLDQSFFVAVQTPAAGAAGNVLPQDQIVPFLGGGPLLRSTLLPAGNGIVVALGGVPVELVIASDMSVQYLQHTSEPRYLFRVCEKMALRIKEAAAIAWLN